MRIKEELQEYQRFHGNTGCSEKSAVVPARTDRPVDTLTPFERKAEYYGLLMHVASPGVVNVVQEMREKFPAGLVKNVKNECMPGLDAKFSYDVSNTAQHPDFTKVLDVVYRQMRQSLNVCGELWANTMEQQENADYRRLEELIEPETVQKYGERALMKRVVSATAQTASVGLGFQDLIERLYLREHGRRPLYDEMVSSYAHSVKIALRWADFNRHELLALEAKIRKLRPDHEGIEVLQNDSVFSLAENGDVLFEADRVLPTIDVAALQKHTEEGRFGCPGKKYITSLWEWTGEISDVTTFNRYRRESVAS